MSRVAGHRTVVRLLLFGVIAAGVVGMHTLGHPSAGGHHGGATRQDVSAVGGSHLAHAAMSVVGSGSDVAVVGVGRGLDPTSMCLAILVGFTLAVLLTVLMMAARGAWLPGRHRHRSPFAAGRGPPLAAGLGLRLADLSVLRI